MYGMAIRGHLNRTEPPKMLPERFMLEKRALMFPPYHMFYEALDRKIQQLIEDGLIEYHLDQLSEYMNLMRFAKQEEPFKVLTLSELEAGFVVSLVPLVLSIVVFCIERLVAFKAQVFLHFQ